MRICVGMVAIALRVCAEPVEFASLAHAVALELPVVLDWPGTPTPTIEQLYGDGPDFSVQTPGFDSVNRAFIRERWFVPTAANGYWWTTGTVKRLGLDGWETSSFDAAVRAYLQTTAACYFDAGGEQTAQIVFDRDDHAYTVVQAKPCTGDASRVLMLHSDDFGVSWDVLDLGLHTQFAHERPHSPEPLEGPPAILLWNGTGSLQSCDPGKRAGYGDLFVVKPALVEGELTASDPVKLSARAMHISSHSGGSTMLLTRGAEVFAAWGEVEPAGCIATGSPVWMGKLDLTTSQLTRVKVDVSYPTNDAHNRPAILMDTSERLHLMIGAHQCSFRYRAASQPRSIALDQWSGAAPTIEGADPSACDPVAKQTYVSFVRDRDDGLHLVYRQYKEKYALAYQRRPAGGAWSDPTWLIDPAQSSYGIYYHQLAIDRDSNLYLLLSYFATRAPRKAWFASGEFYKYSTMMTSRDQGATWEWASTQFFADGQFWMPASSAIGDLDGNGRDDLAHVFYDHGLNVRTDYSDAAGWRPFGRFLKDGPGMLQFPVLAGDVDGDTRDDLVFVFRHWSTNALTVRSKLATGIEASQTQGASTFPSSAYPTLVPLIGDVNGDGRDDIVLLSRSGSCLVIETKRSSGDGTWTTSTQSHAETTNLHTSLPYPPRIGRVDLNNRADLVFVERDPAGPDGATGTADDNHFRTTVKLSGSSGNWTTVRQWHSDGPGVHQYPHLLGDVDGDGCADLVLLFRHWNGGAFTVRVKHGNGDGTFGTSVQTQHPDGSQVPHIPPLIGRVDGDACADLVFPHRLGTDRTGNYQIRTFLAVCDGSKNAQWTRTTTRLP